MVFAAIGVTGYATILVLSGSGTVSSFVPPTPPGPGTEDVDFLADLFERRAKGTNEPGGNPHRFIELFKGMEVPVQFFEPDANSFRDDYYYNSRENKLKKKVKNGQLYAWKSIN